MKPMPAQTEEARAAGPTLNSLAGVALEPNQEAFLDLARATSGGPAVWRERKLAEARELFALGGFSRRITVLGLDLLEDFRAMLVMRVPVPFRRPGAETPTFAAEVLIGLSYRPDNLRLPSPGYVFVQILSPLHVWHAQVAALPAGIQSLCLGPRLPAGIRVRELLLMTYGALSMQSVQLDVADAAGVMNPEAARWWLQPANRQRIPLSREPFVAPLNPEGKP